MAKRDSSDVDTLPEAKPKRKRNRRRKRKATEDVDTLAEPKPKRKRNRRRKRKTKEDGNNHEPLGSKYRKAIKRKQKTAPSWDDKVDDNPPPAQAIDYELYPELKPPKKPRKNHRNRRAKEVAWSLQNKVNKERFAAVNNEIDASEEGECSKLED